MKNLYFFLAVLVVFTTMEQAAAEPTRIEVSALAHGAKFIGDKAGGVQVTIADLETGEVLAEGLTRGGTGDTGRILLESVGRWGDIVTDNTAAFSAELDIDTPVQLAITASGPVNTDAQPARASTVTWLLPGEDRTGKRRVVLELLGYLVEIEAVDIGDDGSGQIEIDLSMLCTCPITPGGTWDAERIERSATLWGASGKETVALEHAGEGTRYIARFSGKVGKPDKVAISLRGMTDSNTAYIEHELR